MTMPPPLPLEEWHEVDDDDLEDASPVMATFRGELLPIVIAIEV